MKILTKITTILRQNIDISIIIVIASVLRLISITVEDLWYDEAFTGLMMRIPMSQLAQILHEDPHPPLYFLINKAWCVIFGVNDLALRMLPFIFSILLILFVYKLIKLLFNKETALIAAFLMAINPFMVSYSIEARSYTFYALLLVITALLLAKRRLTLATLGLIALVYTHYMSLAYFPVLGVYYLYQVIKTKYPFKRVLLHALMFFVAFAFIYNFGILSSIKNQNVDWAEKATILNVAKSASSYAYGVKIKLPGASQMNDMALPISKTNLVYLTFIIISFVLVLALASFIKKKDWKNLINYLFMAAMVFVPQLTLIYGGMIFNKTLYVERYLFPSAVFFIIIMAIALKKLVRLEFAVIPIFIYCLVITQVIPQKYYVGLKELVDEFRNYGGEIVFTSPVDYTVGRYYFGSITGNDYMDLTEDNINRIKLYDPQNPTFTYNWWWFISDQARPTWYDSIVITPDESRMTGEFSKLTEQNFGNYKVYKKN